MVKIFVIALLISGCTLENWELDKSINICKDHKGLDFIIIDLSTMAYCNDGNKYLILRRK